MVPCGAVCTREVNSQPRATSRATRTHDRPRANMQGFLSVAFLGDVCDLSSIRSRMRVVAGGHCPFCADLWNRALSYYPYMRKKPHFSSVNRYRHMQDVSMLGYEYHIWVQFSKPQRAVVPWRSWGRMRWTGKLSADPRLSCALLGKLTSERRRP